MSREINADYNQSFILPPSLEDWISSDHPARFIRDFVESLDLPCLGFMEFKSLEGHPYYSNDMLLKVWLYAYFEKIRSSRGMERMCYNDIGAIWLTGNHKPDHNTLWRFFKRNKKPLRKVLFQATYTAFKNGLVGLVLHALDGTKIRAQVSDNSGWHYSSLKKELSSAINDVMKELADSEKSDDFSYPLPEALQDKSERILLIKDALKELDEIDRKHLHPLDKDARMTRCGKGKSFCYNSQAVVDSESGLIVAEDVVSDEYDNSMLVPMVEQAEESLGSRCEETAADAGYYSPSQLLEAEEKGYEVLVNINKAIAGDDSKKFHKSKFTYKDKKDVFICPLGKELVFEGMRKDRCGKYQERIYRCKSFKDCPERDACSREKKGCKITMGPHYPAVVRQLDKQEKPEKKEQLYRRKSIVEPVFGIIKEIFGFRRFTVRGLENVRTQWSLICTTFNLHKLFKLWVKKKRAFA